MFFGTPNTGSDVDIKTRVKTIRAIARAAFTEVPPKIEALLQMHSDELLDLADHFRDIEICRASRLLIYSFYETRDFPGLGQRVVDEYSSRVMISGEEPLPIEADHHYMVKFASKDDSDYKTILKVVQRVEMRWNPETTSHYLAWDTNVMQARMLSEVPLLADGTLMQDYGGISGPGAFPNWSTTNAITNPTLARPFYEVPPGLAINRFIGQDRTISEIDSHFNPVLTRTPAQPCIVTLVGMGGIGKTQLALEYSKQTSSKKGKGFYDVFWFNASSDESMVTDFAKVVSSIIPTKQHFGNVSECVPFLLSKLKSWPRPYLMILDNYDDPAFTTILNYVPNTGPCGVLITSRLREVGEELGTMIEVPLMDEGDGLGILLSRLHLPKFSETQEDDARHVVRVLGNLPLALDQAGAYMASGGIKTSFAAFLERYETKKQTIMSFTPARLWKYQSQGSEMVKSDNLSIFTTWTLSLEKLGSSPLDHARKAHFLTLLAFMDPNRISGILLQSHAKYLSRCPTCSLGNDWMTIFCSSRGLFDDESFRQVVAELSNLSLIRHISEDRTGHNLALSLHPLIRDWAKFRISEKQQRQFAIEASIIVCDLCEAHEGELGVVELPRLVFKNQGLSDWEHAGLLRQAITEISAHLDACVADWKRLGIKGDELISIDQSLSMELVFVLTYGAMSVVDKSCDMLERHREWTAKSLGTDHDHYLNIETGICVTYIEQGRGLEVRALLESLIEKRKTLVSDANETTILSFRLAQIYEKENKTTMAKDLCSSLIEPMLLIRLKHVVDAYIACQFIDFLRKVGLHEEAELTLRRMIKEQVCEESTLGKLATKKSVLDLLETTKFRLLVSKTDTNRSKEDLAEAEITFGRLKDRSKLDKNPLAPSILERIHGELLAAQGDWEKAVMATEISHKYLTEALGSKHPVTRSVTLQLAKYLLHKKPANTDRSLVLLNTMIKESETVNGEHSVEVLSLQHQAATILYCSNNKTLALPLLEELLTRRTAIHGASDRELIMATADLARCLFLLPKRSEGDATRAISLYRDIIRKEAYVLGEIHNKAVAQRQMEARESLALLLRERGKYKEARMLYDEELRISVALHGEQHSDTWLVQQSIAFCFRKENNASAALEVLQKVHNIQVSRAGPEDLTLMNTLIGMGHTYTQMADQEPSSYAKAEDCYMRALNWRAENYGPVSAEIARAYRWLGELRTKAGRYSDAASCFMKTLEWSRHIVDKEYFADLIWLANQLSSAGEYGDAQPILLERLEWAKQQTGADSKETMWSLAVLASNTDRLKRYEDALLYRNAELDLRIKHLGATHQQTANCLFIIASLHSVLGHHEMVRVQSLKAIKIRELDTGLGSVDTSSLAILAMSEYDLKNFQAATELFGRVLRFYEEHLVETDDWLSYSHTGLGLTLLETGETEKAQKHLEISIESRRKSFGEDHTATVKSQFHLARCKFIQGQYLESRTLYERCLPVLRTAAHPLSSQPGVWEDLISIGERNLSICLLKISEGTESF